MEEHNPKDNTTGVEGTSRYLEYRIDGKIKSYEFWNPESKTGTRDLKVFMNVCEKLLELANVDQNLNNDV